MAGRREHGTGSVYQRASDWRWIGTIEAGWHANGTRRRVVVSGKGCVGGCKPRCHHRTEINKRIAKKRQARDRGEVVVGGSERTTVKQWAERYLELRTQPPKPLRPKAYAATASPIKRWIIPTIGHRRLANLTPADVRAVAQAQYEAGRKTATADATQRVLHTMLTWAVREGHTVPERVLKADRPGKGNSDRTDVPLAAALECLAVAAEMHNGTRWLLALLYGIRQGEALGLVEDSLDFDAKTITLDWQLQSLRYVDRTNPKAGFRVPRDHESRHLIDSWHLVRPKSQKGVRVLPMEPAVETALLRWLEIRPENPWGLVFPTAKGRPCNDKVDREEWQAIQCAAGVSHPTSPRWYHVHECRNLAATQLDETGASDNVITSMLGHASILTSRGYMTAHLDAKREAVARLAERLQLG